MNAEAQFALIVDTVTRALYGTERTNDNVEILPRESGPLYKKQKTQIIKTKEIY